MKIFLFTLVLMAMFFSCKPKEYVTRGTKTPHPTIDTVYNLNEEAILVENKLLVVTYKSATVYAGSSQYFFTTANGKEFMVSALNAPEEQNVKLPKNLLDPSKNLEGPPGENPKMVGKKYNILFNKAMEPIEILPVK